MKTIHVGVIGAGGMGSTHARRWSQLPGVKVTALADPRTEVARQVAEGVGGAQVFDSTEAMLASGTPLDVVSVCVPSHLHRPLTEAAIAAGKHVFCEKPMALSSADCDAMIAAAKEKGVLLSVAQVVRFFPEYANAKRLVDSGAVGQPAAIRCRRGGGFPKWSSWFGEVDKSGGILFDLGVHEFDWLLWCFGPVTRVYAKALTDRIEKGELSQIDYALVTLRHASGAVSHVESTWADPHGGGTTFEIAGDAGLLAHDSRKAHSLTFRTDERKGQSGPLLPEDDPYYRQTAAFLAALRAEAPVAVPGEDGRAAVAVAEAARESLRTGRAVAPK